LRSLAVDGREEILFEFEMLLRGVDRYFNLHNLPLDDEGPVVSRDFTDEIRAIRDAINRAIKLARFLLDPPSDRRMVFRKYLESKVVDDRVRRELIEAELDQGTPQESLFLIRSGFVALRGVLDQLQLLEHAGYQLFADVGLLALREITLNKYFKPFRPLEFRPEYDRIKHVRILELVKKVDPEFHKPVSTAFLALFRLLHYLRYVPGPEEAMTRRSQLILALVRSEIASLAAFLEGDLSARLARLGTDKSARAIRVAQELRRETSRIVKKELAFVGTPPAGTVGRARDAFSSMCRTAIGALAQALDSSIDPEALFDDAGERREQARRLRLDLFAFREVCQWAEQALTKGAPVDAMRAIDALKAFALYFRDVSYQLLRYGDYESFDRFTAIVTETDGVPSGPSQRQRLAEDCRVFTGVLDRTFTSVSRREDLGAFPFDVGEGRRLAERFLPPKQEKVEKQA
ncbi:MAG: hypothetical protein HY901_17505, partial [Deltaproteobacteria bacterium]|nr:hypothetical protein [Deltaproteobacteria bacterium]